MIRLLPTWIILLTLPVALIMMAARLVMTPQFLEVLYTRSGFPADGYGFTVEDRLRYGPLGVQFLLEHKPLDFLARQQLPGELCFPRQPQPCSMFNERELRHMADVQEVTWRLFAATGVAVLLLSAVIGYHLKRRAIGTLLYAIELASLATIAGVILGAFTVVVAWDAFFDTFHALFFEEGTWRFLYSDTLIRLYPEQFWVDSSIAVGAFAVVFSLIVLAFSRWCRYRQLRADISWLRQSNG